MATSPATKKLHDRGTNSQRFVFAKKEEQQANTARKGKTPEKEQKVS
jgi:hypothetical protein